MWSGSTLLCLMFIKRGVCRFCEILPNQNPPPTLLSSNISVRSERANPCYWSVVRWLEILAVLSSWKPLRNRRMCAHNIWNLVRHKNEAGVPHVNTLLNRYSLRSPENRGPGYREINSTELICEQYLAFLSEPLTERIRPKVIYSVGKLVFLVLKYWGLD